MHPPLMRAVLLREFGPPRRLVAAEVPIPTAGRGEVLIEVAFANVTFVETQIRAGRPPNPAMAPDLPAILGNGVGGTVAAVGDGIDPELCGRRVVSSLGGSGGYAEFAVAKAESLVEVAARFELPEALAVLTDGRTALMVSGAARPTAGEAVLVLAAAGGVGSLLVQLAARAGARVIAAAGGERKLQLAYGLGADVAVDYRRDGWTGEVGPVDVVFDGVGGELGRAAAGLLRPGGRLSSFGMASGSFADVGEEELRARGATVVQGPPPDPARLVELSRQAVALATAGEIRPVIGQRFPLERASAAHAAIEARETLGKTLLTVA